MKIKVHMQHKYQSDYRLNISNTSPKISKHEVQQVDRDANSQSKRLH